MSTRPPITLAIESTNPGGEAGRAGVCLGSGDAPNQARVIASATLTPSARHDDALAPAIAAVCRDAGVRPRDLARVAVSIGPGGYTAIRIAATTAKMIADASGAGCVPVPTAEALAWGVRHPEPRRPAHILLAWKRDTVWRQSFRLGPPPAAIAPGRLVPLAEALPANHDEIVVADPALQVRLRELTPDAEPTLVPPEFDPALVFLASLGRPAADPAAVVPLYPREPEAVTAWRARNDSPLD